MSSTVSQEEVALPWKPKQNKNAKQNKKKEHCKAGWSNSNLPRPTNFFTNPKPSWKNLTEMTAEDSWIWWNFSSIFTAEPEGFMYARSMYACVAIQAKWYQEQAPCLSNVCRYALKWVVVASNTISREMGRAEGWIKKSKWERKGQQTVWCTMLFLPYWL